MKKTLATLAAIGFLLQPGTTLAETDWSQVDATIGKKATVAGAVHKYGLPRSDLRVTLDGVEIKPGLALGGWVAFEPMGHATIWATSC